MQIKLQITILNARSSIVSIATHTGAQKTIPYLHPNHYSLISISQPLLTYQCWDHAFFHMF